MRISTVLLATWFLGAVLGPGCGRGNAPQTADAGPARTARPVVVVSPRPHPWPRLIVLHGQLEADQAVQLSARVEGPVEQVTVDLGDHVRAGATLARIASVDFRAHVAQAQAQLGQARSDLARIDALERPEAVSAQAREQARTAVAVAESALALANRELHDSVVRAPFAGAVANRAIARGTFVRIGTVLFDFVSDGPLRLSLEVPERYVRDVRVGTKVTVMPEEVPGDEGFEAEIVRISPIIGQQTRTFRVEARVDPREGLLRPGLFVLGHIALGMDDTAVRLPRNAVYSVLGHDKVSLVVGGRVEVREVELLGELEGDAMVHGISAGDVVVSRGGSSLSPGMEVRVEAGAPAEGGR